MNKTITCTFEIQTIEENYPIILTGLEKGIIRFADGSKFEDLKKETLDLILSKGYDKETTYNEIATELKITNKVTLDLILRSLLDEGEIYEPEERIFKILWGVKWKQ